MRKMNPPTSSREAAQECSPQRKLWVAGGSDTQAPKGRNNACFPSRALREKSTLRQCFNRQCSIDLDSTARNDDPDSA